MEKTDPHQEINQKLDDVLAWANQKLAEGQEPPWSWYQFMKLREAIEAIRSGTMEIPTREVLRRSTVRLEAVKDEQDERY